MNKRLLFHDLIDNAESCHEDFERQQDDISDQLFELQNRRADAVTSLPWAQPPKQKSRALRDLRRHFGDRVTLISLVLSRLFPEDYLFYRTGDAEAPVFEGFAFFADVVSELAFDFDRVGRTGIERYLVVNNALRELASRCWPSVEDPQSRLTALLYQELALLFTTTSDYNRYWIAAGQPENTQGVDRVRVGESGEWAGKREMMPGDLVFLYVMSDPKAITAIFEVSDFPYADPWGAWNGYWVEITKLADFGGPSFAEMRKDSVLRQWGPVQRNFQGTVVEAMPHAVYNRLLQLLPEVTRDLKLIPEPLSHVPQSGSYASEAEFEEKVIEPLLRGWSWQFTRQAPCWFPFGVNEHCGRIDFLVRDTRGIITLIESKLRVVTPAELESAVAQARSYALIEGAPSFVVAAPEGLWCYALERNRATLVRRFSTEELSANDAAFRELLLSLRR
jgi:hypothetical protein